jgi:hypothetical protein
MVLLFHLILVLHCVIIMAFKIQQFAYVGMLPIIYTYYFINLLLRFFLIMKYSMINVLTIFFFFIESLYSENNVRTFHLSVEMAMNLVRYSLK